MKTLARCILLALAFTAAAVPGMYAQMSDMGAPATADKPIPSPPATATVSLAGKEITIHYNTPHIRGRKIMGGLVPYGQVWRTGANAATTLITPVDLTIGDLKLPAGTYTLFTLPTADKWTLIVSTKTGEWGIPYPEGFDLGRTPMSKKTLPAPQEVMSISFEHTKGKKTQLHVKWETTDVYVPVDAN